MQIHPLAARPIALLLAVLCLPVIASVARRLRDKSPKRRRRSRFGFYPNAAGLGIALQQLQAIVHPQVQHVIEVKLDEHADEDDEGGPLDPTRHLHRQARKISRGEPIDCLTAILPPRSTPPA